MNRRGEPSEEAAYMTAGPFPAPRQEPAGGEDRQRMGPDAETVLVWVGGAAVVAACLGFFTIASFTDADTWVPVGVLFSLTVISYPIISRLSGTPRDSKLFKILLVAFGLKMLFFTAGRYYLVEVYYEGEGDAARYDQAGDYFIQNVANGEWSIEGSELNDFPRETRTVGYIVGALYLVFGTTYYGGFLIFSWMSWIGLICFFKAFRIAYPNAPPYRVAYFLFFLPSMLFWPSSLGKDALMVFSVGVLTLGVTRVMCDRQTLWGIVLAGGSGYLIYTIRPHLLVVMIIALLTSALARSPRGTRSRTTVVRVLVVAAAIPMLTFGLSEADKVFGGEGQSIEASLNETVGRTTIGGSAFETRPVRTPADFPEAVLTVLYRPFLFEAQTVPVFIAAAEGTLLMILSVAGARWLWRIAPAMVGSSVAAYWGGYVAAFIIAFSNVGNAGILTRQRVQMFPVLMLLAAAAHEHHRTRSLPSGDTDEPVPDQPNPSELVSASRSART